MSIPNMDELKRKSEELDATEELAEVIPKPEDTTIVEPFPVEAQKAIATQVHAVLPEIDEDNKPRDPRDTIRYGEYEPE